MTRQPKGKAHATVTELVVNFREACLALLPMLDRASIPWTDAVQYDNWDRIAEALFKSLVLEPCRFQAEHEGLGYPVIQRYGFSPAGDRAFINIIANGGTDCRFVRLASGQEPFGDCVGISETGETILAVSQAEFSLVVLDENGQRREIKHVDLSQSGRSTHSRFT